MTTFDPYSMQGMSAGDLADLKERFMSESWSIKHTQFRMVPFSAFKGYEVFDYIREGVGHQAMNSLASDDMANLASLCAMLFSMPSALIDRFRADVFRFIEYRHEDGGDDWQGLFGHENDGLRGHMVLAVYELIFRGFIVNFSESLTSLFTMISSFLGTASPQSAPEEPYFPSMFPQSSPGS